MASAEGWVSAVELAGGGGVSVKSFRAALRRAKLPWHKHCARWQVPVGGAEHEDMIRILGLMAPRKSPE